MSEQMFAKGAFEAERGHLRSVAYRILGSASDAEDAVQEAWLRLSGVDPDGINNFRAWLTTVVGRICLDMLRARSARREEPIEQSVIERAAAEPERDLEGEAMLADSVGVALLITLDRLEPHERLAFVLHDIFAMPFEQIAPIIGRSVVASRQIASRARRRVRGEPEIDEAALSKRREVISAFLAASQEGDFRALVALLDPSVELRVDPQLLPEGAPTAFRGAEAVGRQALLGKGRRAQLALVEGRVGIVVAGGERLDLALSFEIAGDKISRIDLIAHPDRLQALQIAVLGSIYIQD